MGTNREGVEAVNVDKEALQKDFNGKVNGQPEAVFGTSDKESLIKLFEIEVSRATEMRLPSKDFIGDFLRDCAKYGMNDKAKQDKIQGILTSCVTNAVSKAKEAAGKEGPRTVWTPLDEATRVRNAEILEKQEAMKKTRGKKLDT